MLTHINNKMLTPIHVNEYTCKKYRTILFQNCDRFLFTILKKIYITDNLLYMKELCVKLIN